MDWTTIVTWAAILAGFLWLRRRIRNNPWGVQENKDRCREIDHHYHEKTRGK